MEAMYRKISKDIYEKINTGVYKQGSTIPTEFELAEMYQVSRPTIRQAVQLLVDDGYLEKRKKRGTIVCAPKIRQNFVQTIANFESEAVKNGFHSKTTVLSFKKEKPNIEVSTQLHLNPSDMVYKLVRLRYIDQQPNVIVTTYVPWSLYPDLEKEDMTTKSLYDYFEECKNPIYRMERKMETIKADATAADLLDIDQADPMFYFHSVGFDRQNRRIEYSISKYRGDTNYFSFQLCLVIV